MNEIIVNLEGKEYQINIQKAKDLGILKEKDARCKSWEEFKLKYKNSRGYFYESTISKIHTPLNPCSGCEQLTQQEAIAIQAFSKLLKLRRDWIGTWEPNWCNSMERKYYIAVYRNEFYVNYCSEYSKTFSFPTREMAEEFLKYFKDLFEQCKMLI
jgi:hypothetical protein